MKQIATDINRGFRVKHKLKLENCDPMKSREVETEVETLSGIETVSLDPSSGIMELAYDGSQHQIDEFLLIAENHGVRIGSSWWNRLKLRFARQVDQNVLDNSTHESSCCSGKSMMCCKNIASCCDEQSD
jgi:hypothetical protein